MPVSRDPESGLRRAGNPAAPSVSGGRPQSAARNADRAPAPCGHGQLGTAPRCPHTPSGSYHEGETQSTRGWIPVAPVLLFPCSASPAACKKEKCCKLRLFSANVSGVLTIVSASSSAPTIYSLVPDLEPCQGFRDKFTSWYLTEPSFFTFGKLELP